LENTLITLEPAALVDQIAGLMRKTTASAETIF